MRNFFEFWELINEVQLQSRGRISQSIQNDLGKPLEELYPMPAQDDDLRTWQDWSNELDKFSMRIQQTHIQHPQLQARIGEIWKYKLQGEQSQGNPQAQQQQTQTPEAPAQAPPLVKKEDFPIETNLSTKQQVLDQVKKFEEVISRIGATNQIRFISPALEKSIQNNSPIGETGTYRDPIDLSHGFFKYDAWIEDAYTAMEKGTPAGKPCRRAGSPERATRTGH